MVLTWFFKAVQSDAPDPNWLGRRGDGRWGGKDENSDVKRNWRAWRAWRPAAIPLRPTPDSTSIQEEHYRAHFCLGGFSFAATGDVELLKFDCQSFSGRLTTSKVIAPIPPGFTTCP
jgi:hypothetical protein